MKRNNSINKRYIYIAIFFLLLVGISLGYSRLMATLSIDGDVTVSEVRWDMKLNNISVEDGSYTHSGVNTVSIDPSNKNKISYTITLDKPGDFYEFTYDIVNNGTLASELSSLVETGTSQEVISAATYIDYQVIGIPQVKDDLNNVHDVINAGTTRTVRVRIEYLEGVIDGIEIPGSDELDYPDFTLTKTFEFSFVQH